MFEGVAFGARAGATRCGGEARGAAGNLRPVGAGPEATVDAPHATGDEHVGPWLTRALVEPRRIPSVSSCS